MNVFHLTSTLPEETWNAHRAYIRYHWVVREINSMIIFPPQPWAPNSPGLYPVDYIMRGIYCNRRSTKHESLIWTNWNSDWKLSAPSWITSSLASSPISVCQLTGGGHFQHCLWLSSLYCTVRITRTPVRNYRWRWQGDQTLSGQHYYK